MFFYIANLVETRTCVTLGTNIVDGIFITLMTLVVIFILAVIIGVACTICRKNRQLDNFKKDLRDLYRNIYKKNFNVEKFIETNKQVLDTLPLEESEYAIIKDRYTHGFEKNREYKPECCIIC